MEKRTIALGGIAAGIAAVGRRNNPESPGADASANAPSVSATRMEADRERKMVRVGGVIAVFMAVISFVFRLPFLIRSRLPRAISREGSADQGTSALRESDRSRASLLREWRTRKKILRRHRRDSGTIVSVEVSGSRTRDAVFIIRRIGEPEHHVVQIRTDDEDCVPGSAPGRLEAGTNRSGVAAMLLEEFSSWRATPV